MGTRVKKLARELGRSPREVLGLLHALGFQRYKNINDQVSDTVARRVRKADRKGVRPLPVQVPPPRARKKKKKAPASSGGQDLMQQLVPGIVPVDGKKSASSPPPKKAATKATPAPSAKKSPENQTASALQEEALASERRRMDKELEKKRQSLQRERESLDALREALDAERDALDTEKKALETLKSSLEAERDESTAASGASLSQLLAARGLSGRDEEIRALTGLLKTRMIAELLPRLMVDDPVLVTRILDNRLVLFGGSVPDEPLPGVVPVTVAPDRSDLPGWSTLKGKVSKLYEELMLNGYCRVVVVGGRPVEHGLLRVGLDPRVELSCVIRYGGEDADVVLLFPDGKADTSAPVIQGESAELSTWIGEILDGLREDV